MTIRNMGQDDELIILTRDDAIDTTPEATSIVRAMGLNKPNVDKFFDILREQREKYKKIPLLQPTMQMSQVCPLCLISYAWLSVLQDLEYFPKSFQQREEGM
ncbi:hypothetical protein TNCV_3983771 [Trichonephila clavipes]|nr:hypothetical protein TNCV_3983771 [Trichonephila clavipes]